MTIHFPDSSVQRRELLSPFNGYDEEPLVSLAHATQPLVSVVPGIEQMVEMVQEKCNQSIHHLSSDESGAIMLYTLQWKTMESSFRFLLNAALRSQVQQTIQPWFLYVRLFIYALSKLPSLPFHTVYHGVKGDVIAEYQKGDRFVWWNFVACQSSIELIEKSMDESDSSTVFIIECEIAKDISEYSYDEDEIILYPARQFEVISSFHCGNKLNLIQLRETDQRYPLIAIPPTISVNNPAKLTTKPTSIDAHSMQYLVHVIDQCRHQSKVNLISQHLTDGAMPTVVQHAIVTKQCKSLLLSQNMITSNGASTIAEALNNNSTLEFLSLSYNCIGDQGVQSLTNILSLNNCQLKTLSLHSTDMTDESVAHLCKMLQTNTILTWLHLGSNKITDRGVELLVDVLTDHNDTLKVLGLSRNISISDASVDSLVEMFKHNTSLETLWINECQLSHEGKKKLQQSTQFNKRLFVLVV